MFYLSIRTFTVLIMSQMASVPAQPPGLIVACMFFLFYFGPDAFASGKGVLSALASESCLATLWTNLHLAKHTKVSCSSYWAWKHSENLLHYRDLFSLGQGLQSEMSDTPPSWNGVCISPIRVPEFTSSFGSIHHQEYNTPVSCFHKTPWGPRRSDDS